DVRHHPSEEDMQMLDFLAEIEAPTIVCLTKVDKLKPGQVKKRVHEIAVALRLEDDQMIPFSAETNQGRDDLAEAVVALVGQPSWRAVAAAEEAPPEEPA
ncbi:MAG: GTP-binding protein engB, partial [Gemmatimonadetes bacterium]|nr:GTP-binding protein engB [Gemmatimonadota bacterium]